MNQKDLKIHLNYVTQIKKGIFTESKKVHLPNQKRYIYRIKKSAFTESRKVHLSNQKRHSLPRNHYNTNF